MDVQNTHSEIDVMQAQMVPGMPIVLMTSTVLAGALMAIVFAWTWG